MSQDNRPRYVSCLDLGQAQEFTALAVLETTEQPEFGRKVKHHAVRHLERFGLGTAYTAVCDRLALLFREAPLADSTLALDLTAVGRPVLDLFRKARLRASLKAVTVSGGHKARLDPAGGWLVPKKELVSTLQVLLQSRRLAVAGTLPEAQTLVCELENFRMREPKVFAEDGVEQWRDGPQDDLVLAVAIAAWQSEHLREFWIR